MLFKQNNLTALLLLLFCLLSSLSSTSLCKLLSNSQTTPLAPLSSLSHPLPSQETRSSLSSHSETSTLSSPSSQFRAPSTRYSTSQGPSRCASREREEASSSTTSTQPTTTSYRYQPPQLPSMVMQWVSTLPLPSVLTPPSWKQRHSRGTWLSSSSTPHSPLQSVRVWRAIRSCQWRVARVRRLRGYVRHVCLGTLGINRIVVRHENNKDPLPYGYETASTCYAPFWYDNQ